MFWGTPTPIVNIDWSDRTTVTWPEVMCSNYWQISGLKCIQFVSMLMLSMNQFLFNQNTFDSDVVTWFSLNILWGTIIQVHRIPRPWPGAVGLAISAWVESLVKNHGDRHFFSEIFFFLGGKGQVRDATSRFACVSQILNLIFFKQMFWNAQEILAHCCRF